MAIVFGLIVAAWFLIPRLPVFQISTVTVDQEGQDDVIARLESLKGRSIFSREVRDVPNEILRQYFVVESLNCRRGLPDSLRCEISFRQPAMIWQTGADGRYLVDRNGVVYSEIKSLVEGEMGTLMTVIDNRGIAVRLGQTVANSFLIERYRESIDLFSQHQYKTGSIALDEIFYYFSLELLATPTAQLNPPITLKLTTTYSIADQVALARTILKKEDNQIKESIDLRVPGYAYTR